MNLFNRNIINIRFLQIAIHIGCFLIAFLCASSLKADNFNNQITAISISEKASQAAISFTSKNFPKYRIFTIADPERLVIDFGAAQLKAEIDLSKSTLFKSSRNSYTDGNLRIVFDATSKIEISQSTIINPDQNHKNYRLVINVSNVNQAAQTQQQGSVTPLSSLIADQILAEITDDLPALENPVAQKEVKKRKKLPIIVIDAGHGGKDPGTIGRYARTKEKLVTLAYARELKKALDATGRFRAFLTRDSDYFIPLGERVEKARKLRANLFISLHADSSPNRKTTGLSIYTLSENSSDKEAAKLARKENKSDIIGGVNFSGTSGDVLKALISMSQRNSMNNSAQFAEIAIKSLGRDGVDILQNTHRFAGFRVLTAPDMASVLIELGYLSNKSEERRLNSLNHRRKVANALVKAVDVYFKRVKE